MGKTNIDFDVNGSGIVNNVRAKTTLAKHAIISGSGSLEGGVPTFITATDKPGYALTLGVIEAGKKGEVLIVGLVQLSYDISPGKLYLGERGRLSSTVSGSQLAIGFAGNWVFFSPK